jgi:hypothetical protein
LQRGRAVGSGARAREPPPLRPIGLDTSNNEEQGDAAREASHLDMAHRNSLMTVFIDVWEKAKCRCDTVKEEECNVLRAKRDVHLVKHGAASSSSSATPTATHEQFVIVRHMFTE